MIDSAKFAGQGFESLAIGGAVLASAGAALLGEARGEAVRVLLLAASVALWGLVWVAALDLALEWGWLLDRVASGAVPPLAVTLAAALSGWIAAALLVRGAAIVLRGTWGVSALCGGPAAMAWAGALLLPRIGQGGLWPLESILLTICSAALALLLARLSETRDEDEDSEWV